MGTEEAVRVLLESRLMRAREDVVRFEGALEFLSSAADAELHLVEMHLAFDGAARHPEVMYGLVHLLESFDVAVQARAFVEALDACSTWQVRRAMRNGLVRAVEEFTS